MALHEFGHVLGLDHPDQFGQNVAAIMNSTISNTDSLQQDDINGALNYVKILPTEGAEALEDRVEGVPVFKQPAPAK